MKFNKPSYHNHHHASNEASDVAKKTGNLQLLKLPLHIKTSSSEGFSNRSLTTVPSLTDLKRGILTARDSRPVSCDRSLSKPFDRYRTFHKRWHSHNKPKNTQEKIELLKNARVFPQLIKPGVIIETSPRCKTDRAQYTSTRRQSCTEGDLVATPPKLNPKVERKINDIILKLNGVNTRYISPSPKKHAADLMSNSSESDSDDSEEETHDVWDNTDLELRGVDVENELQRDGHDFSFFHWYKARFGSYPNKRAPINNKQVVDAIVKLGSSNRQLKDIQRFLKPDYQDTSNYSVPFHQDSHMNIFLTHWKEQQRAIRNAPKCKSKRSLRKQQVGSPEVNKTVESPTMSEIKLGRQEVEEPNEIYNPNKRAGQQNRTSPVKSQDKQFKLRPFMMPLGGITATEENSLLLRERKEQRPPARERYLEVVKRDLNAANTLRLLNVKTENKTVSHFNLGKIIKALPFDNRHNENPCTQPLRGEVHHVKRPSSTISALISSKRNSNAGSRKNSNGGLNGIGVGFNWSDLIRPQGGTEERRGLESILPESKPKIFRV